MIFWNEGDYTLKKKYLLKDISSSGYDFYHNKTGLRLIVLKTSPRKKDDLIFTVTFKTPTLDNRGIPHILEHCIISEIHNKSPELDFGNCSSRTLMDRTIYEFKFQTNIDNLLEYVLRNIFVPSFLQDGSVFLREGWRNELSSEDAPLEVNGVVYNEMKETFTNPLSLIPRVVPATLVREGKSGFISGGIPEEILKVTPADLRCYYLDHYSTKNCTIFIQGSKSIGRMMDVINNIVSEQKLPAEHHANAKQAKSIFTLKEGNDYTIEYPFLGDESNKDIGYICFNWAVHKPKNAEECILYTIFKVLIEESIEDYLVKAKKSLSVTGNSFSLYSNSTLKPYVGFAFRNADCRKKGSYENIVRRSLEETFQDKINQENICDLLKKIELSNSRDEKNRTKCSRLINETLYTDILPFEYLKYLVSYDHFFERIDMAAINHYYRENFLNNCSQSTLMLIPSLDLFKKRNQAIQRYLTAKKKKLSKTELEEIMKGNDLQIDLPVMPVLNKSLGKSFIKRFKNEDDNIGPGLPIAYDDHRVKLFIYENNPPDNIHFNLYFDLGGLSEEELLGTTLIAKIINSSPEMKDKLSQAEISIHSQIDIYPDYENYPNVYPKLVITGKRMGGNERNIFRTLFLAIKEWVIQEKSEHIKHMLLSMKTDFENSYQSNIYKVITSRLSSYFSLQGLYEDLTFGVGYYDYLCKVTSSEEQLERLFSGLVLIINKIFVRKVLISIYSNQGSSYIDELRNEIPFGSADVNQDMEEPPKFNPINKNEGIIIPTTINYICQGYNYKELGYVYSSPFEMFSNMIFLDYLFPILREKCKVYSCALSFYKDGRIVFYSLRDPNIKKTFDIFNNTPRFLDNSNITRENLNYLKRRFINNLRLPNNNNIKYDVPTKNYISNFKMMSLYQTAEEVLKTDMDDFYRFCHLIESVLFKNNYCVFGNGEKIIKSRNILASVRCLNLNSPSNLNKKLID